MPRQHDEHELLLANRLAEAGLEFNQEIHEEVAALVRRFPDSDYFRLVVAVALTWTGHAIGREGYYPMAVKYLKNGSSTSLKKLESFADRLGSEKLVGSLQGWREILLHSDTSGLSGTTLHNLRLFHDKSLLVAKTLKNQGTLHGVGAWLFCAPFKIIVTHRDSFWTEAKVDEILMPLGMEVIRGVNLLFKRQSSFVSDIDRTMIAEEEGGLIEGLGTVSLVQSVCQEIGRVSGSRVVHVNSGLYLYGRNELA